MNPTYGSSFLYDKNRPIYNSPTPLNYRPTTTTYSQPTQYTSHYTSNIIPNSLPSDNHSLTQSPPTNYAYNYYPNNSVMSPKAKTTTEYPSYKPAVYSYTPNVTNSRMSPPRNVVHSAKLPKGSHLSSLEIDEFSERNSVQTQYMSPTGQKHIYSAPKGTHMAAQQPLHSISGVHYVPNVRVSPFNRSGKDKINFFEPQQHLEKRDEPKTTALQFQYGSPENQSKGPQASALQSLLVHPKTPKRGRIKIPEVIFKRHLSDKIREVFTSPKTFECLAQFFDFDDLARFRNVYPEHRREKELKKIAKRRLDKLILNIKTKEDQYKFWNSMVDFRKRRNDNPLAFSQHFVRKCEYIRDITKDLDRTFPEYDKFQTEKGRDGLLKVLVAISNTIKEVGYIQGLNSVAAVFLYYLKEEESFWILLYLMERAKAKEIFKTDFTRVSILNYQLETFVHYYLPTVAEYFNEQPMSLTTLTTQWFITLYAYCLSIPNIARIWNYFFVRGYPFFIQFGLAIFSRYKRTIMTMSVDEIGPFFKEELRQLDENDESIFRSALEFKVTTRLLNDLEVHYKKGKPRLLLIFDTQNKGQWTEIPSSPSERPADISISSQTNISSEPHSKAKAESATIKNPTTPTTTTTEQPKSATIQSKPKVKSPISLQNIVNTIKIDLSDTIKNIFNRKDPNKEANTEPNSAVINKSSFIEDEKTTDKSLTLRNNPAQPSKLEPAEKERDNSSRHNNSILMAEMQNSRPGSIYLPDQIDSRTRIDPSPSGQDTFKSSYSDLKSVYSPIKPPYSPRFKAGQFDLFSKESSPVISVGEGRTPLYGRSKIRPTNNSIDASDFSTWSAEKDFIRNLQINLSNQKYQDVNTRSTNNSLNNFNGIGEDIKRSPTTNIGNKNRLGGDGSRAQTTLTLYPIDSAGEDLHNYGANYKKNFEGNLYNKKSATSSPVKHIDLQNKVMMRNDVMSDLPSSSRKTGYYSVIGDFKKYP